MKNPRKKVIKGFLLAPLVPVVMLYIEATAIGIYSSQNLDEFFFWERMFWFFQIPALPFSYLIAFIFGIPMFLLFKKFGLTSLWACLIEASFLGILSSLIFIILFRFLLRNTMGMYLFWFFHGTLSGATAGYVFWQILYKAPASAD